MAACSKFSYDMKSAPWTDRKDDHVDPYNSGKLCTAFHNALPDMNSNKIAVQLRAICVKAQLYGPAEDPCSKISDDKLLSPNRVWAVVKYVYKKDALSVFGKSYCAVNQLWNIRRGNGESIKNFRISFFRTSGAIQLYLENPQAPQMHLCTDVYVKLMYWWYATCINHGGGCTIWF